MSLYDDIPDVGAPNSRAKSDTRAGVENPKPTPTKPADTKTLPSVSPATTAFQPRNLSLAGKRPALSAASAVGVPRALLTKRKRMASQQRRPARRRKRVLQNTGPSSAKSNQISPQPQLEEEEPAQGAWCFGHAVADEYDPARPNDYDTVKRSLEDAAEASRRREAEKDAQSALQKQYRTQATAAVPAEETGDDAYRRRVQMSMQTPAVPVATPETPSAAAMQSSAQAEPPSRVVLLTNMVAPGGVDDQLAGETAEECQKYGPVLKCSITELRRPGVPDDQAVRIFVVFGTVAAATKAKADLNGRFFARRTVRARFFPIEKYNANQLED